MGVRCWAETCQATKPRLLLLVPIDCWSLQSYHHWMPYLTCPQWPPSELPWDSRRRASQDTPLCLFSPRWHSPANFRETGTWPPLGPPFSFTSSLTMKAPNTGPPGWPLIVWHCQWGPGPCSFQIPFAAPHPAPSCLPASSYLFKHLFLLFRRWDSPVLFLMNPPPPQILKEANDLVEVDFLEFCASLLSRINHSEYGQVLVAYGWWYE